MSMLRMAKVILENHLMIYLAEARYSGPSCEGASFICLM